VTYRIEVGASSQVSFSAELKYQSLAYGFVEDLLQDRDNPEVARLKALYANARIHSETIASVSGIQP